jgi:hypothetical protein
MVLVDKERGVIVTFVSFFFCSGGMKAPPGPPGGGGVVGQGQVWQFTAPPEVHQQQFAAMQSA